jgi:tRNA modification GTPase
MNPHTDIISALATPYGTSALAVIRTTGQGSIESVSELFSRPDQLKTSSGGRVVYGFLIDPDTGQPVDEVTVIVWRSPHSYTGQDSAEILCHGSMSGVQKILSLLQDAGFRSADPGEFTLRSFLSGKRDLTEAEAVHEVVTARTRQAHALALHRLSGGLSAVAGKIRSELITLTAEIDIQLDYPEEETGPVAIHRERIVGAREKLQRLSDGYRTGRLYHDGVRVVIAGRTNAGKSSLFNLFIREERAIVSEIHGTTRDYLEVQTEIDGVPVLLFDTAGLRDSGDLLETEGIRRSGMVIDQADLVLYVQDATLPDNSEENAIIHEIALGVPVLIVKNKIDLLGESSIPVTSGMPESLDVPGKPLEVPEPPSAARQILPEASAESENPPVFLSAATGEGFSDLVSAMRSHILPAGSDHNVEVVVESLRQKQLLDRGAEALEEVLHGVDNNVPLDLVRLDLQDALNALGELTGEIYSEEILDAMFSQFCVGK